MEATSENDGEFCFRAEHLSFDRGVGFIPIQVGVCWEPHTSNTVIRTDDSMCANISEFRIELKYKPPKVLSSHGYPNVCLLKPGTTVNDVWCKSKSELTFCGFKLERDSKKDALVAVFKDGSEKPKYQHLVYDSRRFKEVRPPDCSTNCESPLSDLTCNLVQSLRRKCGIQRIRGIPLLDLMHYLAFGTGASYTIAIVGGAVRDTLRKEPFHDIDIVVLGCEYHSLQQFIATFFATRGVPVNDAILHASGKSMG